MLHTSVNPTVSDATVPSNGGSVTLTGLKAGTTYHVRAYARSVVGVGYSSDVAFTTSQGEQPNSGDNPQPGWE